MPGKLRIIFLFLFCLSAKMEAQTPDWGDYTGDWKSFVVRVQAYDGAGKPIGGGAGVKLRNSYVACNSQIASGAHSFKIFMEGVPDGVESNGFLAVNDQDDLLILSVPGLKSERVQIMKQMPEKGQEVMFPEPVEAGDFEFVKGEFIGKSRIAGKQWAEVVSEEARAGRTGPVFADGKLLGFIFASYYGNNYHAFFTPAAKLEHMLSSSFIIKSFKLFTVEKPGQIAAQQKLLLDQVSEVLWLKPVDAGYMAQRQNRIMLFAICTPWNGWCQLMENKTFSDPENIRFLNEHFACVKVNAESKETLSFLGQNYPWKQDARVNQLAYDLLNGVMEYPATVFIDRNGRVLTVVRGLMTADRLEVLCHYVVDAAYAKGNVSFEEYELQYLEKKRRRRR